jgi:hypothetical protein
MNTYRTSDKLPDASLTLNVVWINLYMHVVVCANAHSHSSCALNWKAQQHQRTVYELWIGEIRNTAAMAYSFPWSALGQPVMINILWLTNKLGICRKSTNTQWGCQIIWCINSLCWGSASTAYNYPHGLTEATKLDNRHVVSLMHYQTKQRSIT